MRNRRLPWIVMMMVSAAIVAVMASPQQAAKAKPKGKTPPLSPVELKAEQLKKDVAAEVDGMQKLTQEMVDSIFSFSELGFQEMETKRYCSEILKKYGFTFQENVAGMPSGWTAVWGSGKPVIAIGSDVDGLAGTSQKPGIAARAPYIENGPGHGEGHNTGVPLSITTAIAVKKIMEREKLSGTILVWPGIAEELLGGKAQYVRAGVFKDVDVVLFNHISSGFGVSWGAGGGTGAVSVEYTFKGQSAHAGGSPWQGKSALDAVELMDVGWNFRREHLRLTQRSHNVITDGGGQPNVVPPTASSWYYFREIDYPTHQADVGHRQQDGRRGGDDDRHDGHLARARIGLAAAHEQGGGRDGLREHQAGRHAAVGRGRPGAGQGRAAAHERPRARDGDRNRPAGRPGGGGRQPWRRVRRHR